MSLRQLLCCHGDKETQTHHGGTLNVCVSLQLLFGLCVDFVLSRVTDVLSSRGSSCTFHPLGSVRPHAHLALNAGVCTL